MDLFSSEEITSSGHSPIFFSCLTSPVVTVWISSLHPIHVLTLFFFFFFFLIYSDFGNGLQCRWFDFSNSSPNFHFKNFNNNKLHYFISSFFIQSNSLAISTFFPANFFSRVYCPNISSFLPETSFFCEMHRENGTDYL